MGLGQSMTVETMKAFTIQLKNTVIPAWMLESSQGCETA
jgi:hypothetical protein